MDLNKINKQAAVFDVKDKQKESELSKNELLIKTQQERINKLVEVQEEMKNELRSPSKIQMARPDTERKVG